MTDPAGWVLPTGLDHVRTTPTFDVGSVPAGLRRSHEVAAGVWGRLVVSAGSVVFVDEPSGARRVIGPGAAQVIPPARPHHVEPDADARFAVEFHRPPRT